MTSQAPLSCAVCSVKFEDLDALLQHMAGHTAPAPVPAPAGQAANTRQIVLSQTAFLRLQPILQQNASKSMVMVMQQPAARRRRDAAGPPPLRPRPPAADPADLDVEVIEPPEPEDPADNECRVCKRRFKHKYSLVAHCRQHLMSRLCGVCHRRLPDGEALVLHLETHMEKNSTFKCDQCDKSFVHAKSLYVHKRNHSGVRPYTCQYCFKTFRHWHKHRVHVRIHTGERPYQCEVCGWGFPRNDERKRHMRTHVGRKAFHCIDCGVGCGTQVALMRHVEIHHGKGKRASDSGPVEASEEPADAASPADRSDAEAECEPEDTADENFDDLDEQITVKIEMDGAAGVVDDGDEDSDDPPYQPCSSESESDADAAPAVAGVLQPDVGVDIGAEPARDPIATDEPVQPRAGAGADGAGVVVKEEPPDAEHMDEGPTRDPWGSEDSELDDDRARLLEPEVNLTEMFIDIERMRSTIRRKIAANAHKFDDAVTLKAKSFVRDPEPNIDHMRSILRAKLEEGKRIQQLLRQNEAEKRRLQADIERGRKQIKLEPVEADGDAEPSPIFLSKRVPSVRLRRLSDTSRTDVSRRWMSSLLSAEGGEPGRTSDPSATPRTPRRRWIQHQLNFAPDDGVIVTQETPAGLRMSTGFGQL